MKIILIVIAALLVGSCASDVTSSVPPSLSTPPVALTGTPTVVSGSNVKASCKVVPHLTFLRVLITLDNTSKGAVTVSSVNYSLVSASGAVITTVDETSFPVELKTVSSVTIPADQSIWWDQDPGTIANVATCTVTKVR